MSVSVVPSSFSVIDDAPVWMSMSERVVLFALVFGRQPERSLEIGTFRGGSSLIICAALDDLGSGSLVCVDPSPQVTPENWQRIQHRATMISGGSPEVLPQARERAGGAFDFALIDGDHSRQAVIDDLDGVIPLLADDAYILLHDAHYFEVAEAIDEVLTRQADQLADAGLTSIEATPDPEPREGQQIVWGGLRLLRFTRS